VEPQKRYLRQAREAGGTLTITLPRPVQRALGIVVGDQLVIQVIGDLICVQRLALDQLLPPPSDVQTLPPQPRPFSRHPRPHSPGGKEPENSN